MTSQPETLQKIQARTRQFDEQSTTSSSPRRSRELQALMASMDIIATQRLFLASRVEMAHHHNRVDIEHGPIHFAIREDQLQLTPLPGASAEGNVPPRRPGRRRIPAAIFAYSASPWPHTRAGQTQVVRRCTKLIALDMDGTLLTPRAESPRTQAAIAAARQGRDCGAGLRPPAGRHDRRPD